VRALGAVAGESADALAKELGLAPPSGLLQAAEASEIGLAKVDRCLFTLRRVLPQPSVVLTAEDTFFARITARG